MSPSEWIVIGVSIAAILLAVLNWRHTRKYVKELDANTAKRRIEIKKNEARLVELEAIRRALDEKH